MTQKIEQVASVLVFGAFRSDHTSRMCACYWSDSEGIGYDAIGDLWDKSIIDDFGGIVWIKTKLVKV